MQKYHHRYGNTLDRGNLANIGHHRLLAGFTRILAAATTYLRPGGHVVITIRPWREHSELVDLPAQILGCGVRAGLVPVERCVALLARVTTEGRLVTRGSDGMSRRRRCACWTSQRSRRARGAVSFSETGEACAGASGGILVQCVLLIVTSARSALSDEPCAS